MKRIVTACLLLAFATSGATAQWSTFHGDAQRSGLSAATGPTAPQFVWSAPIGGPILTSPVIGPDGAIYVGPTVEESMLHPTVVVTALEPTGSVRWRFRTPFVDHDLPTLSTPAIGTDGTAYFGAPDGFFYAVDAGGRLKWRVRAREPQVQSPVLATDGSIYVGLGGELTKIRPDGFVEWRRPVGDPRQSGGPSLAPDGSAIYISGATTGTGASLYAYAVDGTLLWSLFLDPYFWPLAPPTVGPDGTIYTATTGITAVKPDGSVKWFVTPTFGMSSYASIAVDAASNLYYTAYVYVWKLDSNGNTVWTYTHTDDGFMLGSSLSSILVDQRGLLFMGLGAGKRSAIPYEKQLLVLTNGGKKRAAVPLPEIAGTSSPALANDGTLYIGCLDGKLYAYHQ